MAARLARELNIPHISTGDIIRAAIRSGTELGNHVKKIVESGSLVSDELTVGLVKERLAEKDAQIGFILDGFPRTIPQADALKEISAIERVINFVLEESEIIRRLSGRRVHEASGRTYHVLFNPPTIEGKDDLTGEPLSTRPDDQIEAIKIRLQVYRDQTSPLIGYYGSENLIENLNAAQSPDQVFDQLLALTGPSA